MQTYHRFGTSVRYSRQMPRTKQRTPEMRARLLDSAVDVLGDAGSAGFTTRRVARAADTSPPAVYELFGDRAGLIRAVFFEGFRRLGKQLAALAESDNPRADLVAMTDAYRGFVRRNPELAQVMFSRPFTDFSPAGAEIRKSGSVRERIVAAVRRCLEAGVLAGDEVDIAHAVVALTQGLAAAETARRLGRPPLGAGARRPPRRLRTLGRLPRIDPGHGSAPGSPTG
jgi:AcrR family transcriptional regulator